MSEQKEITYDETGYSVYIPEDCTCDNGFDTLSTDIRNSINSDGFTIIPPDNLLLNDDIAKLIFADVNGNTKNTAVARLDRNLNKLYFTFNNSQWSSLTTSYIRDGEDNLITNLAEFVKNTGFKVTPKPVVIKQEYSIDSRDIDKFSTTTADCLTITVTSKEDYFINSLNIQVDNVTLGGIVDNLTPVISADKKTATITVPKNDNISMNEIDITGNFISTKIPDVNPKGTDSIRIYSVDDYTLKDITNKAMQYFQGGTTTLYNFQNFIDQLYKVPYSISADETESTTNIITGWFTINDNARKFKNTETTLNVGKIKITPKYNNGFDDNVDSIYLYLPWLQPLKLDYERVLGHELEILYKINLLNGKTNVIINIDNQGYLNYQSSIIQNIQLYNIYSNIINGTLNSTLVNDIKQAYVIITYFKPIDNLISYNTNEHGKLNDYTGYVKIKNGTIKGNFTTAEYSEILSQLQNGIVINGNN